MTADRRAWSRDVRWGIAKALAVAVGLTAFVGVASLLTGGANLRTHSVSLAQVAAVYFGGALIFGTLVGLFRPIVGEWFGASVVGVLGVLPFIVIVRGIRYGWVDWSTAEVVFVSLGSLLLGSVYGVAAWYGETRNRPPDH